MAGPNSTQTYDIKSAESIFEYSKGLLGKEKIDIEDLEDGIIIAIDEES